MARIAHWQVRSRLAASGHEWPWINGSVLVARGGHTGASGNIYFGLHEVPDMAFIGHLLRPGDIFIDGGANIGSYSVLAGAVCGASVHAFEPAAETLPWLKMNFDRNRIAGTVHAVALGASNEVQRFTRGRDSVNALSDAGDAEVQVRRLDDFALAPAAIKLDLEGAEEHAIEGATATLADPALLAVEVETVTDRAAALLARAGLERRWYDPFARRLQNKPTGAPNNQLWVRNAAEIESRLVEGPRLSYAGFTI